MRRKNKLKKFFMLGVIPFLFTGVLSVALLIYMGVDVGAEVTKVGKNIPFIGHHFADGDGEQQQTRKIEQLTNELSEKNQHIIQLEQQLQTAQEKMDEWQSQNRERASKEQTEAEKQWLDSYKQVAKSLAGMSASKAAAILSQMPPQEGLMVIYSMKAAEQSQLLSKLPPAQAATYTTMLKELLQLSNHMSYAQAVDNIFASDGMENEQVFTSVEENEGPAERALVFASMQPLNAAAILEEMDEAEALNILRELDIGTQASILSRIETQKASRFSQTLVDDDE